MKISALTTILILMQFAIFIFHHQEFFSAIVRLIQRFEEPPSVIRLTSVLTHPGLPGVLVLRHSV
jgi:hypothetical protein